MKTTALPVILILLGTATAYAAGDIKTGEALYNSRCIACHSVDANRVGPMHRGVFGRKAGTVADYEYSAALKASKIVWNDQTLNKWLEDPEVLIPGQNMGYSVESAQDRQDLIAYLKSMSKVQN